MFDVNANGRNAAENTFGIFADLFAEILFPVELDQPCEAFAKLQRRAKNHVRSGDVFRGNILFVF